MLDGASMAARRFAVATRATNRQPALGARSVGCRETPKAYATGAPSSATAGTPAARETALLMPEARPAESGPAALIAAVVRGEDCSRPGLQAVVPSCWVPCGAAAGQEKWRAGRRAIRREESIG